MPLQIRRGTNAERLLMAQPLAAGELLYVTDDERLYIGNNATLGGVQVTGYNDENARDAAAAIFTSATHSGISFVYNDTLNTLTATVSNTISGVITAAGFIGDVRGSVFADDSTILVDGVAGVLRGTLLGNVVGDVRGSFFADDSTVLVDGVGGVLRGTLLGNVSGTLTGTVSGNLTGDVIGSIFADDGTTVLVDGVLGLLAGTIITQQIQSADGTVITIGEGTGESMRVLQSAAGLRSALTVAGLSPLFEFNCYSNSHITQLSPVAGETLGQINFKGLFPNSPASLLENQEFGIHIGAINCILDPDYIEGDDLTLKGSILIRVSTGIDAFGNKSRQTYSFTPTSLEVPTLSVMPFANPTARDAALPLLVVAAGMMVFLTDSTGIGGAPKLQVNTDSTITGWVDLH